MFQQIQRILGHFAVYQKLINEHLAKISTHPLIQDFYKIDRLRCRISDATRQSLVNLDSSQPNPDLARLDLKKECLNAKVCAGTATVEEIHEYADVIKRINEIQKNQKEAEPSANAIKLKGIITAIDDLFDENAGNQSLEECYNIVHTKLDEIRIDALFKIIDELLGEAITSYKAIEDIDQLEDLLLAYQDPQTDQAPPKRSRKRLQKKIRSPQQEPEEDLKFPAKRSSSRSPDPPKKRQSVSPEKPAASQSEQGPQLVQFPVQERAKKSLQDKRLDPRLDLVNLEELLQYNNSPKTWKWDRFSSANKLNAAKNIVQFGKWWLEANPDPKDGEYYDLKLIHSLNQLLINSKIKEENKISRDLTKILKKLMERHGVYIPESARKLKSGQYSVTWFYYKEKTVQEYPFES